MKVHDLPPIQGKRFDIETLQYSVLSLAEQAEKGPTFIRVQGRVSFVMLSEEAFSSVWPDPRRVWSITEMPDRQAQLMFEAIQKMLSGDDRPTE